MGRAISETGGTAMLSRKYAVCVTCLIALLVAGVFAQNAAQDRQGRDLLYVGVPGSVEPGHDSGVGILVFDVRDNFRFLKRIPTFHRPASDPAGEFEGVHSSF